MKYTVWDLFPVVELSAFGEEAWSFLLLAEEPGATGGHHLETKPLKDWFGA